MSLTCGMNKDAFGLKANHSRPMFMVADAIEQMRTHAGPTLCSYSREGFILSCERIFVFKK